MAFENILAVSDGGVMQITINRPDKLNALNLDTLVELGQAFDEAAHNQQIRVIILTGSGEKAFVAGADISEINQLSPIDAKEFSELGQQLMLQIENLGKPVIAAVNGFSLGGGCELALACSIRLASDNARFGLPEIKLGIMPGFGGTQRLVRMIGRAKALELTLTGTPITADEALQLGMISKVYSQAELLDQANQLASSMATAAPIAMRHILHAVQHGADMSLQAALDMETQLFALCCSTNDMQEGTTAFLEKRAAQFTGH